MSVEEKSIFVSLYLVFINASENIVQQHSGTYTHTARANAQDGWRTS